MHRRVATLPLVLAVALAAPAGAASAPLRADLQIGATASVPASAPAGDRLTVRLVTRNAGRAGARASRTQLLLSRDARRSSDDVVLGSVAVPALRARRSRTLRGTVGVPAATSPGRFRLLACADATGRVRESRESGNCRALGGLLVLPRIGAVSPVGPPRPPTAPAPGPAPAPAPAPPAAPAPTPTPTPAPTATPAPTPTPTPTPAPGITFSANPIVLGALSYSFTNDEAIAAARLVTVTNSGATPTQRISIFTTGLQNGQSASLLAIGEAHGGNPGCAENMILQPGASCGLEVSWRPRQRQGDLSGTLVIRVANTATAQASVPIEAAYAVRSFVTGGIPAFDAVAGFKNRRTLTLTNEGDVPGSASLVLNSTPGDDAVFYVDPTRTNTCTNAFPLAPDASCTVPIAMCAGVPTPEGDPLRSTVQLQTGGATYLTVELRATVRENDEPRPCGGIFDEE